MQIAGTVQAGYMALIAGGFSTVEITKAGKVRSDVDECSISMGSGRLLNKGVNRADEGLAADLSDSGAFTVLNSGKIVGRIHLRGSDQEVTNSGVIKTGSDAAATV